MFRLRKEEENTWQQSKWLISHKEVNVLGQYFEEARKRIRNINWEYEDDFRPSHPTLVAEFIRRGNVFLDYIYYNPDNRRAVFSAAQKLGINLPIDIEETCTELNQIKLATTQAICTFYLEWAYLADQGESIAIQFQDLYDPIIKLYQKGGTIFYRHGQLWCGGNAWGRNSAWMLREGCPPFDIRDEALAEEDKEYYLKEITNEVKKYSKNLNIEKPDSEEIAADILRRLQDYSHTSSKEIIIKVELAKLYLSQEINDNNKATNHLQDIKKELEQFKLDDLEKMLPEAETKDLSMQIIETLKRLSHLP